ncbi:MAG: beta-lactamase family protein [Clostridia bacterium]|nr:beta-lactamase family protein [Clostridia bacterium]
MKVQQQVTHCLEAAVANHEAAGLSVLVRKDGEEVFYASAGLANIEKQQPIQRNSIFRLYSQSKPVTAVAVMLLAERGIIDLMDPVEKFLPGFRNQKVITEKGLVPAARSATVLDLLGMTAGLSYPGDDEAGQYAARVFEENDKLIAQGGGMDTVTFCNRLGQQPVAFQPGSHFRYSTCADILGAVVEIASGKKFGDFLQKEIFQPLGMKDTDFYVPAEKMDHFVTAYYRSENGLQPWLGRNLCVGVYDHMPAFQSGGAGLVSTLDDYAAFTQMLMNKGEYNGHRILSPAAVAYLTTPQLGWNQQFDMWDSLEGFSYGKLMRVCTEPGRYPGFACKDEYGWDGWLGTYFANLPNKNMTILLMQNTTDAGTTTVTRKVRNVILSALSKGEC